MLLLILLVTSSAAARLERFLGKSRSAECSRETAGRTTTIALALLGALPLWLGPAAELLASREPWLVDALIGASPLTHLAVASGNDLLRNPWFYQHANLAALRFSYPGLTEIALLYGALAVTLALVSLVPSEAAPCERRRPSTACAQGARFMTTGVCMPGWNLFAITQARQEQPARAGLQMHDRRNRSRPGP